MSIEFIGMACALGLSAMGSAFGACSTDGA